MLNKYKEGSVDYVKIYKCEIFHVITNFKVKTKLSRKLIGCCIPEQVDALIRFYRDFFGKNVLIETEQEINERKK